MIEIKELKRILRESVLIVLITIIIAFTVNLFHPRGYVLVSRESAEGKIVFISSVEAKIKHAHGSALFIDSRDKRDYLRKHIDGAIHIPAFPESLSLKKINEHFDLLKKLKEIVIYCSGRSCETDETLARRLLELGYERHIFILYNGLPEWEARHYPIKAQNDENEE
jgi:rhodanese-related sulfurtransferase